jgi:hypothetical protein
MSDNTDFVYKIVTTSNLSGTFGNTWDSNVSQVVVDDALLDYGVVSEADMTDTTKKKALLKYFTWVKIRDMLLLTPSSYSADGESFSFNKDALDKRVAQAKAEAGKYLSNNQIQVGRISFPDDPYSINGQIQHNA